MALGDSDTPVAKKIKNKKIPPFAVLSLGS